ncbi:MAG: RDD family protein [Acidimicrobiales bacterium]
MADDHRSAAPGGLPSYPGKGGGPDPWYVPPSPGPKGRIPFIPDVNLAQRSWDQPKSSLEYGGFWARAGGYVIDGVLVSFVSALVGLAALAGAHHRTTAHRGAWGGLIEVVWILIAVLYPAVMISVRGQTVGMMMVKLKAVDSRTGGPISFWRALGRSLFGQLLFAVFVLPGLIDLLFPAWDARRQCLHDKVAGTVVVRDAHRPAYFQPRQEP